MGKTYRSSPTQPGTTVGLQVSRLRAASGVVTASRAQRPTARVASHLDPLSAPRTGPQIWVVREGRDGPQSHPGVNVPIEEIHLHEVTSTNGHVVPPSRQPRVLLYPLEPPANQAHYPGSVEVRSCRRSRPRQLPPALVAQWIEQRFPKPRVAGSIPAGGTNPYGGPKIGTRNPGSMWPRSRTLIDP
jgi:hypothetical protein